MADKAPSVITLSVPFLLTAAGCEAVAGHRLHCTFCRQCKVCGAAMAVPDA